MLGLVLDNLRDLVGLHRWQIDEPGQRGRTGQADRHPGPVHVVGLQERLDCLRNQFLGNRVGLAENLGMGNVLVPHGQNLVGRLRVTQVHRLQTSLANLNSPNVLAISHRFQTPTISRKNPLHSTVTFRRRPPGSSQNKNAMDHPNVRLSRSFPSGQLKPAIRPGSSHSSVWTTGESLEFRCFFRSDPDAWTSTAVLLHSQSQRPHHRPLQIRSNQSTNTRRSAPNPSTIRPCLPPTLSS